MDSNIPVQQTPPIVPETQTPAIQPTPSSPSTPSRKTKYILLGLLILLIIAAVGGGTYYLGVIKQKSAMQKNNNVITATVSPTSSSSPIPTPTSTPTPGLVSELHGFPVYPNSTFVGKAEEAACQNGLQFGGTIICGSTSYTWTTPDDFDKVTAFYKQAGWCMGAGSYDSPRSAMAVGAGCNKNGFIYGTSFKGEATKTTIVLYIPTQTSQTGNDPTKVVNDFYSAYVDCLQKWDTANLKGTGPASPNTCPSFSTYPVFSSDLISKLNQVKGADPILCAQNIPASIKVDTANTNGNTSSVTVHTYYLSSGDNPIQVGLTLENNNWLITSITCTNGIK